MEALRAARPASAPSALRGARPAAGADVLATLRANVEAAGGRLVSADVRSGASILRAVDGLRQATHLWSGVPGVESRGIATTWTTPADLSVLDCTLLPGELAVAESGAVWNVPADPGERAAALLAEHLVLVVARDRVVGNLHDAYARIDASAQPFGWLLSGPSKTADIEQSLVLGAHGPRRMTLLLLGE
jgi:L-lactate dehydrogenase complex protein LldG